MHHESVVTEKLKALAAPCLASMGLVLWGVELGLSGRRQVARLFLDLAPETPRTKERQGVTVDECAACSRRLSALLDVEDFFHGAYVLEVSSPGLDRRFFEPEQMSGYVGREIEAKLTVPRQGRKRFRGLLSAVDGPRVAMTVDPGPKAFVLSFDFADAEKIRLIHALDAISARGTDEGGAPSGTSEVTP